MRIRVNPYDDFMETVTLQRGFRIPMSIQRVADGDDPDMDFRAPRLACKVRPNSLMVIGDILKYQNNWYLAADRHETIDYRSFWLYKAERSVSWKRNATVTDPVTNLPVSAAPVELGPIWVTWETMSRQPVDRPLGVSNEVNRVLTVSDVRLNDLLDGQQVKRVNNSMGLRIVEVS